MLAPTLQRLRHAVDGWHLVLVVELSRFSGSFVALTSWEKVLHSNWANGGSISLANREGETSDGIADLEPGYLAADELGPRRGSQRRPQ